MPETIQETLCLDYANSDDRSPDRGSSRRSPADPQQTDVLRTEDTLRGWGRCLGLLSDEAEPASAVELRRARALRAAVYSLFASVSQDQEPARKDLDVLMSNYVQAVKHASLLVGEDFYKLDWLPRDPRTIRYAVATDAIALLQDPGRLKRVSRCPGRGCGWLFLNTSGRRRWCSMSTCGSRDKMRRLHQRWKQQRPG